MYKILLSTSLITAQAASVESSPEHVRHLADKTGVSCGDGTHASDCNHCGVANCDDSKDCELRNSIGAVKKITPVCAPIGGVICKTGAKSLTASSCQACPKKHGGVCSGECKQALTSKGASMCQNTGLEEYGIMFNISKEICKSKGKTTLAAGGRREISGMVAQVFKRSLCIPEGPFDWYQTSGHLAKMWCSMIQESLKYLPEVVTPTVLQLIKKRHTTQCVNNAVHPSFLQTVGVFLDGEVMLDFIAFFTKKICVANTGASIEFFKKHQILYVFHVMLHQTNACAFMNTFGVQSMQVTMCALGSAQSDNDELAVMLHDGSFSRIFGETAAAVAVNLLTSQVLRDLHRSMQRKCQWTSENALAKTKPTK